MTSLEMDKQVQTASDRKLHFIIAGSKLLHLIFQEFGLEFIFCPEEDLSLLLHVDLKKNNNFKATAVRHTGRLLDPLNLHRITLQLQKNPQPD